MPHAATKQISRIPHALTLATFLFLVVTLATLLPSSSHAQSPNDSDFSPSPTDVPPQKKRLPTAPPINLPSTGSGGLFPTSDPSPIPKASLSPLPWSAQGLSPLLRPSPSSPVIARAASRHSPS